MIYEQEEPGAQLLSASRSLPHICPPTSRAMVLRNPGHNSLVSQHRQRTSEAALDGEEAPRADAAATGIHRRVAGRAGAGARAGDAAGAIPVR